MFDFQNIRQKDLQAIQQIKAKQQRLVLLRTISFIVMVFAFAAGWDGHIWGVPLGLVLLVSFLILARRHRRLAFLRLLQESHLSCTQDFLDCTNGKWRKHRDDGHDLFHKDRPQEMDLPIFGPASLYQYLNRTRTEAGRRRLADMLSPFPEAPVLMREHQEAVKELSKNTEKILALLALSHLFPHKADWSDFCTMVEHMDKASKSFDSVWRVLSFLLPLISCLCLIFACLGRLDATIPGLLFSLQLLLTFLLLGHNQALFTPLSAVPQEFAIYEKIFVILEKENFQSKRLQELQKVLRDGRASENLHRLAALADKAAMRRNIFFFLVANTLCLWDFHCSAAFSRWQKDARHSLRHFLTVLAEYEALLSLTTPALTRKTCCWPKFTEDSIAMQGKNITPLLLDEKQAVPNDASFTAGTCIITGSNMSGKTTYMRTLATSAILAYAGAPVCAVSFSLTPMRVFTSIHVSDDLSKGISTFYAEILRIRQMVEASREKHPLFLCIDEIFKGTNSADRITGAAAAIRRLTTPHAITLVTTHDFELCNLQSSNDLPIKNYHFEEYYKDDKIHFDFKLKPDRCHTTNAKYLLKMAGILA